MKLFLIGGTGNIGSRILAEALSRGHDVTVLTRDPSKVKAQPHVAAVKGDILNSDELASQIKGHDAVVVSYSPGYDDAAPKKYEQSSDSVIAAARKAKLKRVIWVGGAASLEVKPGVQLLDTLTTMPPPIKNTLSAMRDILYKLRKIDDLDWTFFSPAGEIAPGPRTGKSRRGTEQLVVGTDGKSRISIDDYAIAMVDELEKPKHLKKRFTVGY